MTTLEEHVARAIWKARHERKPYELASARERSDVAYEALAAIAAVHEREEPCPTCGSIGLSQCRTAGCPDDPAEAMRSKTSISDCKYTGSSTILSVPAAELMATKAVEAMRARCEEIARAAERDAAKTFNNTHSSYWAGNSDAANVIADTIAALRGKPVKIEDGRA